MMLFTDQHRRKCDAYFLANKDAATTLACLTHYKATSEHQTGMVLVAITTNNSGEFANGLWEDFCNQNGITHHFMTSYSSAANGIGECGNCIVFNMVHTMLHDAGLAGM